MVLPLVIVWVNADCRFKKFLMDYCIMERYWQKHFLISLYFDHFTPTVIFFPFLMVIGWAITGTLVFLRAITLTQDWIGGAYLFYPCKRGH